MRWMVFAMFAMLCMLVTAMSGRSAKAFEFVVARCRATCLQKFEDGASALLAGKIQGSLLSKCWQQCQLMPRLLPEGTTDCKQACNSSRSVSAQSICYHCCGVISTSTAQGKSGSCPRNVKGRALVITNRCSNDFDCHGDEKCCQASDRRATCHTADFKINTSLPMVLGKPIVEMKKRSMKVTWKERELARHLVYIVEWRSSKARLKPDNGDAMSVWQTVGHRRENNVELKHLVPDMWYQFRVAAVSSLGHNGFSEPTEPTKTPAMVRRPSQPRHLRVVLAQLNNRTVDVTLEWEAPAIIGLPITKYKIVWLKDVRSTDKMFMPIIEHKMKVSGNASSVTIGNLDQASTYKIEIHAIVHFKGTQKVKGERARLSIETPGKRARRPSTASVQTTKATVVETKPSERVTESTIRCSVNNIRLDHNGNGVLATLQWKGHDDVKGLTVYWKGLNCSQPSASSSNAHIEVVMPHPNTFHLRHLRPFCLYIVKVTPFYNNDADGKPIVLFLSTDINNHRRKVEKNIEAPSSAASWSQRHSLVAIPIAAMFLLL